ncbi:MAG TPA: hypothetical protein VFQ37_02095 [Mycobacterium sp.]|nr:hypothetical protein [Mycobacterium sp.]
MVIFVDQLIRFAAEVSDPRVTAIAERVAAPLRVAVSGRRGVGRRTVAHALRCAGTAVTVQLAADVVAYVVAEVVKPEDTAAVAALAASPQPVLVVLNKVDLTGGATAAGVSARIGAPAEPMAGLLAVAALDNGLDDTLWAALQLLAAEPADLSCADRFVTGPHPLTHRVRRQLCDTLDLPGITNAVAAVRQGRSIGEVRALLRRLSGVDAVVGCVDAVGVAVHYRRLLDAVAQLEALAVSDSRIGEFLSGDDAVVARMAAAVDVVEAAGLTVESGGDPAAQLRRARRWQCYRDGPVAAVHRACAADIARGSLRLWMQAGKPVPESV